MECAAFPVTIQAGKRAFNYDVNIEVVGATKKLVLNKEKADPQDKDYCRELLRIALEKSDNFGCKNLAVVYDGLSCLYSNYDFADQEISIEPEDFTDKIRYAFKRGINVLVSKTVTNHELNLSASVDKMSDGELSEFKRFLSMAVCQDAINRGVYSVIDHGHLFSTDPKLVERLRNGMELRPGVSKGIRIAEGGKAVFEVDFCTSAYYRSAPLSELLDDFTSATEASQGLRGVRIAPLYEPHRSMHFAAFSTETPKSHKFLNKDNITMSVLEYFQKIKNAKVSPNLPLVQVRPSKAGQFPADQVKVVPHQKVRCERMGRFAEYVQSANTVKPHIRHKHISTIVQMLNFSPSNPILKTFGISLPSTFTVIPPAKIWRPSVQLGGMVTQPKDNGAFRVPAAKYIAPAGVKSWAVLYGDRRVDPKSVNIFIERLCADAKNKGMNVPRPVVIQAIDMHSFMAKAFVSVGEKLKEVSYILVIDPKDPDFPTHGMVKLIENRYKKVTQHLDAKLVQTCVAKNQRMTLENIINKMNLKLGGCNYAPKFEEEAAELALDKGTFVIGYQTGHSRMSTEKVFTEGNVLIRDPSVLGFTANYAKNANLIAGNWLYQEAEHENVDPKILEDQMHHALTLLAAARPAHAKPKTIVVLRDGISEHQYQEFISIELEALKSACTRIAPTFKPKFVLIVTTKEHDTRVFARSKEGIINPPPGTVIDQGIVRRGSEFLIIPQHALIGTAQPVKVTVVKNETAVGPAAIQKFVHALSYTHQLTCSPTALPEPIYQADILAKRGLSSLQVFKTHFATAVPRHPDKQYNIAGLNDRLTMRNSVLERLRFTA